MFGNSMCNLVPHHRCQPSLVLGNRQNTTIYGHLAARHTPSVDLVFLDEVKLPMEIVLVTVPIFLQETVYRVSNVFTYALHHLRLRSEEHTSELQSLMRISYAVFCLKQ